MMILRNIFAAIAVSGLVSFTACTASTTPDVSEQDPNIENTLPSKFASDTIVASVADSGGCAWGGVCSSYNVRLNGVVEVLQPVETSGDIIEMEVVAIRRVPAAQVEGLLRDIETTDFEALKASFDKGSCQGCVDGIDNYITLMPGNGDFEADTVKYDLRKSLNVFSQAFGLIHTSVPGLPDAFDIDTVKNNDVIARVSYLGGRAFAHYAFDIKRNGEVDVLEVNWPLPTKAGYEKVGAVSVPAEKAEALLKQIAQTDYAATLAGFKPGQTQNHIDGNDTYVDLLPGMASINTSSATHAFHTSENVFASAAELGNAANSNFRKQQNKAAD